MSYLFDYLLFLAQVATLTIALIALVSSIAAMGMRVRKEGTGHLELRRLNDDYDFVRDMTEEQLLSSSALRKVRRLRNKEHKREIKQHQRQHGSDGAPNDDRPRVFVIKFDGDVEASASEGLRQQINGVLRAAREGDEVLVRLFSAGGVVHGYGFAASQLARLKAKPLRLVIAVDQVAASGGYLMACIADELIASPFALVGSIGVVVELPNVHRLLKRHEVDVELITAGEHKRTLTIIGQNTDQGREKLRQEIEDVHALFKEFVLEHRPTLDLERVATGEAWYGRRALDLKLIDRLMTSDEYLQAKVDSADLLELNWVPHRKGVENLLERFAHAQSWLRRIWRWVQTRSVTAPSQPHQ